PVREVLLGFSGVGPKVADCICLMGFGFGEVVPVDTHVWQIAKRDYGIKGLLDTKTLTPKHYEVVGKKFQEVFGDKAGWAHSVLFTADLKQFESRVTVTKSKKKTVIVKDDVKVVKMESEVVIEKEEKVEVGGKKRKVEVMSEIQVKDEVSVKKDAVPLDLLKRVKLDRRAKRKRVD
ncbi:8-oxoguanine glycosylase ogg1, partial [Rhizophlyctis rosea]